MKQIQNLLIQTNAKINTTVHTNEQNAKHEQPHKTNTTVHTKKVQQIQKHNTQHKQIQRTHRQTKCKT